MLHEILARQGHADRLNFIDGKAMLVHACSSDPDAHTGMASGRYSRGYKLHARVTHSGFLAEYAVLALRESEVGTARRLLNGLSPGTLVLADAAYDSGPLYEDVAERGAVLLTRLKGQHMRQPGSKRRAPPSRQAAIDAWTHQSRWCERAMVLRSGVERRFAHLGGFGGGLGPLPAWVRRLPRVQRWVDAKIAVYHARLLAKACRSAA